MNTASKITEEFQTYFDQQSYQKIIKGYEESRISFDSFHRNIVISYFRLKEYTKVIDLSKKIDVDCLETDYLVNEVIASAYYQCNDLENAYKYYKYAVDIKPNLKSAWQSFIVLKFRLNFGLTEKEIDKALKVAEKLHRIEWLRELSYLYYSLENYEKANYCLDLVVSGGSNLNYIDQLVYSLKGVGSQSENILSALSKRSKTDLINKKHIKKGNSKLVITFSPHAKFVLQGYKFNEEFDLLHIGDESASYYTFIFKKLATMISSLVQKYNYKDITLVGTSKGGTGCLILYMVLSKYLNIPINCIAFSPQISLYPFNKNLTIPSYRRFINICEINPIAKSLLVRAPSIKDIKKRSIDSISVIYGSGFEMDKVEVEKIANNIDIYFEKLDYNGHSTLIPYTIPQGKSYRDLEVTYANLRGLKDEDFQALGGGKTIDIIDQIWKLYNNPRIDLNSLL